MSRYYYFLVVPVFLLAALGCTPKEQESGPDYYARGYICAVSASHEVTIINSDTTPEKGKCTVCGGTGRVGDGRVWQTCRTCGGDGIIGNEQEQKKTTKPNPKSKPPAVTENCQEDFWGGPQGTSLVPLTCQRCISNFHEQGDRYSDYQSYEGRRDRKAKRQDRRAGRKEKRSDRKEKRRDRREDRKARREDRKFSRQEERSFRQDRRANRKANRRRFLFRR